MSVVAHWVLQGNPARWEDPDRLYTAVTRWCVSGVQRQVAAGDGVLLWMAHRDPLRRGVHAVGLVTSDPAVDQPSGKPFVALDVDRYVTHDPVSVVELRASAFGSHQILRMARRTAYPCLPDEYAAAVVLVEQHGPTAAPSR